jgi:hypothetical protein
MAAVTTQMTPSAAFAGKGGLRAAGVAMESWLIVLSGGTTAATITTSKITRPVAWDYFLADDASLGSPTVVNTPLASGTATLAATGLTANKTYMVNIRGSR